MGNAIRVTAQTKGAPNVASEIFMVVSGYSGGIRDLVGAAVS